MTSLTPHQLKALNTDISLSLTANAGSGKTFVLAKRYLEILLKTGTPISKVVAITFTEKAAGELYKRIASELDLQFNNVSDPTLRKKIDQLRKRLVSAKISTIHSFCFDILKEFPVEASIDANFIPIDQQTANELIELTVEEILKAHLSGINGDSDVKLLIRLLGSRKALSGELAKLVWNRKLVLQLEENVFSKSTVEIAKTFFELFKNGLGKIFKIEKENFLAHLKLINDKVLIVKPDNAIANETVKIINEIENSVDIIEQLKVIHSLREIICTKDGSIKSKEYFSGGKGENVQTSISIVETFFRDIKDLVISENHSEIDIELAKYGRAIINIFKEVLSSYERRKSESASLDFEDLLLKTKELLVNEKVQEELNRKYEYLLVDEYQDTNEIQYQIFLPLVDYLKSGNLFIVGDEKQSIYRFREAELEVFGKTKSDIKKTSGNESLLSLPDSFRMAPAVCLFTNYLFRNLFSNPQHFYNEVEHSDIVCARNDGFEGKVEFLLAEEDEESATDIEAELISKRILTLRKEHKELVPDWADIAVLVRKRAYFAGLERSFTKNKIPYTVVGGTGYYQKQSISDIYNYFAFLFNDKDDAALIGVLRSPFFLVSDKQIFQLSLVSGESYWERLCDSVKSKSVGDLLPIYNQLNENSNLVKRIDIPSLLRKILTETNFISIVSSRPDGKQEVANLNKLISLTIKFFSQSTAGGKTLYDYVNFLRDAISRIEDEAQAGAISENTGVNLVTIHQAKGLEYSTVFLYKSDDTTQFANIKAKSFTINKNFGLLTKVPLKEDFFSTYNSSPLVNLHNFIEKRKNLAELKRLLYVAVTRAKNFLFISFKGGKKQGGYSHSFINLIRQGFDTVFSQDIIIEDDLKFLLNVDNEYKSELRKLKIKIPVLRNIETEISSENKDEAEEIDYHLKHHLLNEIEDKSKGEFISATKFSVFVDCPRKYNLIYNYHLDELLKEQNAYKQIAALENAYTKNVGTGEYVPNEPYVNEVEDEYYPVYNIPTGLKGRIIHKILEKNISFSEIELAVKNEIQNEILSLKVNEENAQKVFAEINNVLIKFYNSDEYRLINSFPNYKNEVEVYLKEEDFYLYGIIDKLITDKKKIIIIDYKTDNVPEQETAGKAGKYLMQLKFYAYIISHLFPEIPEVELRLIFVKHQGKPVITVYNQSNEDEIKTILKSLITSQRSNNYSVNLDHCYQCPFAIDGQNCIIKN